MGKVSEESKNKYMAEALQMWGRTCGSQGNCSTCPIGAIRGANVTCQDFAKQFPQKFLSILKEMDGKPTTYYSEFCARFPEANLTLEDIAQTACRKAIFEGYLDCPADGMSCEECWNQPYTGDFTDAAGEQAAENEEAALDESLKNILE